MAIRWRTALVEPPVVATEAMTYHAAWLRTRRGDYDPDVSVAVCRCSDRV